MQQDNKTPIEAQGNSAARQDDKTRTDLNQFVKPYTDAELAELWASHIVPQWEIRNVK